MSEDANGSNIASSGDAGIPSTGLDSHCGIADVVAMTGISAFTIRYYDKCGFFPNLQRDRRGIRKFSNDDVEQLHLVEALRKSGLSIEGIQYYVRLGKRRGSAHSEQLAILRAQETVLEYQRQELEESLKRLHAATMDLESESHSGNSGML